MKKITPFIFACTSFYIVYCDGGKENSPSEVDIIFPMENEVFKVDSSYRDAFWDYANAFIRTNIQDLDGLRQVSVQVWGNSKEYFNQVYHLKGETTFEVYEEWEYEKTTGNFELRFIVEDIRGENVVKKRRISVME